MTTRPNEFATSTKMQDLARQNFQCASCGSLIVPFGGGKLESVAWGESAHAHHRRPIRCGGKATVHNCVILCESCHFSAHEGGNYAKGTVVGQVEDYPFFFGK